MLVSIIIPIYNVEQYIEQCLASIYAQDISEDTFEVIAVNDGTPDNSMSIVKTKASQHKNLVIINQENQGLSVARNTGLDNAKGEYIWFVDSDDWLTNDSLSIVLDAITTYPKIEVFATILMMQYENQGYSKIEYTPNCNVRTGRDYMFRNRNANRGACQRYIFKKDFLTRYDLKFMPGVYHEDGEFSNRMLYLANSLKIIPTPVYNYRIRSSGSIMSSRKMKMNYDLVKIYLALNNFAETNVKGNDDYWAYRIKIYECLADTILFSRKEIFSEEFENFYQQNKILIKKEARKLLLHASEFNASQVLYLLKFAFIPKLETQIKQGIKRILFKLKLYQ